MSQSKKSLRSGLLLISEAFMNRTVGLLSTLILARVLTPEDFGLVAIAMLVVGFIDVFSKTGSETYILQKSDVDECDINTAWTLDFILKSFVAGIIFISASFVAEYYSEPELEIILQVVSLLALLAGSRNPGVWLYQRNQEYNKIIKVAFIAKVVAALVTVAVAILFHSYWALIIGTLISMAMRSIGSYVIHPFRPVFTLRKLSSQWGFSIWMTPKSFLGYARTQLDTLWVSGEFGPALLGSYHIMKYFAYIPVIDIIDPATKPLLVELAKVRENKSSFNFQFELGFIVTMSVALPIAGFLYLYHSTFVALLLGDQWTEYSNIFGVLALLVVASVFATQARRILTVFEKVKAIFYFECTAFVVVYGSLFLIGFDGIYAFTKIRVYLEVVASLSFFVGVTSIYMGWFYTLKMFFLFVPMLMAVMMSLFVSSMFEFQFILAVNLGLYGLIFTAAYVLFIMMFYYLLYSKFDSGRHVANLVKEKTNLLINKKRL